ncbi:hypothetical protein HELRODRAFT_77620, partial [Helobdella robusta]|uniref:RHD domain-containing protein n=1 Tax=Helobdella robusta TaxID=6412 RepID=T1G309_HELRO
DGPYLEIIEEPQSKGFRFRYACEGKSHGGLQGVNHRKDKKTVPTVKINRYSGMARLEVTLVTDEKIPRHHAHELIGKNCENGKCVVNVKGDNPIIGFPNLGIKHITKKNLVNVLIDKLRESLKIEKFCYGNFEEEDIKKKAEEQSKSLQMSVVRLKFQAYLINDAGFTTLLPPVYSAQIYDSKAPRASLLKICRMDRVSGCSAGNDEVFLLCDKVQKDDISVRFFEQDEEGNVTWEDYGVFSPQDVHRQYAIVFRTPSYPDNKIKNSQSVFVQLKRLSDGEVSDPKTFTFFPKLQGLLSEIDMLLLIVFLTKFTHLL